MLKENTGITLIALVITIIILLILAGTATFTGISAIESSRITTFKAEMEMMQLSLNSPIEILKYEKSESDTLKEEQINFLETVQNLLNKDNLSITLDINGFKYFTKSEIKALSLIDISRDLYINTKTKTIISSIGEQYNGKTYYMLEQLPNSLYNVEKNIQNSGDVTFDVNSDKLSITISNIKYNAPYVDKGTIQYKLSTEENWTTVAENSTSKNFTFEVPISGEYSVRVIDAKNNEKISNLTAIY